MDSDDDQQFANNGGEALELGEDYDDEDEDQEEDDDDMPQQPQQPQAQRQQVASSNQQKGGSNQGSPDRIGDIKGQKVENQPYDMAVELNDSEEIESDENDDVNDLPSSGPQQIQQQQKTNNQNSKPQQIQPKKKDDDDEDDEAKHYPGAYNPAEYANLQVSQDVKDLFDYINRYKPQKIDLDTKLKPFVPDYIPCVGEVDAFLKMPKPDGNKEDLGITVLDEPALNSEDKTVIELRYIQEKNVVRATPMNIESIENADKKPKEIARWINSVQDLHKTRPPATVNYTKQMPDFDNLMQEWSPEMEQALKEIPFPGPEIDMHSADYGRLVCSMIDIPCHKLANNKSVIESLHLMFTLFSEFRQNQHLQNQNKGGDFGAGNDMVQF